MSTNPKDYPEFFIEFLEENGIYEQFMFNMKSSPMVSQKNIEDIEIDALIIESFAWGWAEEGPYFWRSTYEKYLNLPIVKDIIRAKSL